jgi:hypothetical protein
MVVGRLALALFVGLRRRAKRMKKGASNNNEKRAAAAAAAAQCIHLCITSVLSCKCVLSKGLDTSQVLCHCMVCRQQAVDKGVLTSYSTGCMHRL